MGTLPVHMTAVEIRQSFLDFFHEKQHTIVPSSALLPDAPNLLFTNAGMNQFVPFFLGERAPDVAKWAGARAASDTRAADTQKCIRAGGKHNDLDDVGLDTYHQTFFEMLGNWSFGDYFKPEAITWAWELLVERWGFPPSRLYATIYQPGPNDPAERDQEAWDLWAEKFRSVGLDPDVHVVEGDKEDNFWMMGETGPCGPCSELHFDLTPTGDTRGALVNKGAAECIEVWNLVFIQFNANPDGTFSALPSKHVDTGMGFERVCSIMQGTKNFTDFAHARVSNYETDIFRPIFDAIEQMSGKKYNNTLPELGAIHYTHQEQIDIAFRVVADHIRTLTFAVADGIVPGNTDRQYVLRRILRRAVRYGRTLDLHDPFFYKLSDTVIDTMGDVFTELQKQRRHVKEVLEREEISFNRTLDEGLEIFKEIVQIKKQVPGTIQDITARFELLEKENKSGDARMQQAALMGLADAARIYLDEMEKRNRGLAERIIRTDLQQLSRTAGALVEEHAAVINRGEAQPDLTKLQKLADQFKVDFAETAKVAQSLVGKVNGEAAFLLYDTYGFPLDLTQLMAREEGLSVDLESFEALMGEQKKRSQAGRKTSIIELSQIETKKSTHFLGFDHDHTGADVEEVVSLDGRTAVVLNNSVCYAAMGGQLGDTGEIRAGGDLWNIVDTQKTGNTFLHFLEGEEAPGLGDHVTVQIDKRRRAAIERHHTVTHLLHWALHEVVSPEATQKGSHVAPDKLTFDFNAGALSPQQIADIERLVNERILENGAVSWQEVPYEEVRHRPDILQFFGDKYGETVRVVQIGGAPKTLNGYSMELCGGTHTRATGQVGLFRILGESAISAGVRRVEAMAGFASYEHATHDAARLMKIAKELNCPVNEVEHKIASMVTHHKELEKALKSARQREAAGRAKSLLNEVETIGGHPAIVAYLGEVDGDYLQGVVEALKGEFEGVACLFGSADDKVAMVAASAKAVSKQLPAGKLIQAVAPAVDGKGGGRPEQARGAGKQTAGIPEAIEKAKAFLVGS